MPKTARLFASVAFAAVLSPGAPATADGIGWDAAPAATSAQASALTTDGIGWD